MELNVNLDEKAVEQQVVQAVLNSAIGAQIGKAIDKALLTPRGFESNTFVEEAVQQVVRQVINNTIANSLRENEAFKERVSAIVEEMTTDDVLRTIITRIYGLDDD